MLGVTFYVDPYSKPAGAAIVRELGEISGGDFNAGSWGSFVSLRVDEESVKPIRDLLQEYGLTFYEVSMDRRTNHCISGYHWECTNYHNSGLCYCDCHKSGVTP